ncbi:hypothetical protein QTH90_31470 [Variovorax sp. J2P1-59]|uniref:hypothetical protein n=1 Tax=Variovorax flavidus TaxID=3053501 RepID=UPI0025781087|nr:hypothetical protein [Variovorax sp. J2P1-59]MDM0078956.1 hypothetical protein [Variovorax sp. J2P1-59]
MSATAGQALCAIRFARARAEPAAVVHEESLKYSAAPPIYLLLEPINRLEMKLARHMRIKWAAAAIVPLAVLATGCSTTSGGAQYKASTENVIVMQEQLGEAKVKLLAFTASPGVNDSHWCRANGTISIGSGKTPSQFIHDAMQEELFLARSYSNNSPMAISGRVEALSFSSVAPANWDITLTLSSSSGASYQVQNRHEFDSSWKAADACKNVSDAFAPAVQALLKKAASDARFKTLVK